MRYLPVLSNISEYMGGTFVQHEAEDAICHSCKSFVSHGISKPVSYIKKVERLKGLPPLDKWRIRFLTSHWREAQLLIKLWSEFKKSSDLAYVRHEWVKIKFDNNGVKERIPCEKRLTIIRKIFKRSVLVSNFKIVLYKYLLISGYSHKEINLLEQSAAFKIIVKKYYKDYLFITDLMRCNTCKELTK